MSTLEKTDLSDPLATNASGDLISEKSFIRQWTLALFGTAIGAGVLFLPINAGLGGIWPLIFMTLLVGPMTFFAHRGLARFVMSSDKPDGNIIDAVNEHFGSKSGVLVNFGYFMAIFPILLIYGIGITNTVSSMMEYQLDMAQPPRAILSFVLVMTLVLVMCCSQRVVLRITNSLVYPLIVILLAVSVYLIPQWNVAQFNVEVTATDFFKTLLLTIPVLVFAFNHSPAISSFAKDCRRKHHNKAEEIAETTLKHSSFALFGFTMFFVFSCVLTLTPDQLAEAKQQNISVLSAFAQVGNAGLFGWLAQIVAIVAISSSFFGHFMGAQEGLIGLINRAAGNGADCQKKQPLIKLISMIFIGAAVWLVAYFDVSVIGLIEVIVAPVLAAILFIMPVYAIKTVPAMAKYRGLYNIFTLVMGVIAIVGFVVSQFL